MITLLLCTLTILIIIGALVLTCTAIPLVVDLAVGAFIIYALIKVFKHEK